MLGWAVLCAATAGAQVVGTVVDAELMFQPTAVTIAENAGGGHYGYGAGIGTGDIRVHGIDTSTGGLTLVDASGLTDGGTTPTPPFFDAVYARDGRMLVCVTFGGDMTQVYRTNAPALELLESVTLGPGSSVPQTVASLGVGSTEFVLVNRNETDEVVSLGFTLD